MVKKEMHRLAMTAAAMIGLAGCTIPPAPSQLASQPLTYTQIGSVVPVYNPPPNTPWRCVGSPVAVALFGVPGDPDGYPRIGIVDGPFATMGNRRGDFLLVVSHKGVIGWFDDPHEESFSQYYPGMWCHVHQDAQGRIVFTYHLTFGEY